MRGSKRRAIDNRNKQPQDHFPRAFSDCMADKFDEALKFNTGVTLTPFQQLAIKYVMKKEKMSNRRYKRMQRGKK